LAGPHPPLPEKLLSGSTSFRGTWRVERPPLWLAAYLLALLIWLLGLYLPLFFSSFPKPIDPLDFSNYYAGAQIGLTHGWNHIYDLDLQRQVFYQLHPSNDVFDWRVYFVSPPPVAWLVAPFTLMPLVPAFWTFAIVSALAFGACGWLAVPGTGLGRVALFLTAACIFPVLIAIQTGQVTPLVAAGTVLGWWLAKRGKRVLAGVALLMLVLKPQVAILVAPALLIAGEGRLFAIWLIGAAAVSIIALISLGGHGLDQLRTDLSLEQGQPINLAWTLAQLVGSGSFAIALELTCGAIALLVAWWNRERGLELVVLAGILGSLLAAPYHNPSDFAVLAPAAWLYLRTTAPAWHRAWLVVGLLATYLAAGLGPALLLVFTLGWLGLLVVETVQTRHRAGARVAPAGGEAARLQP
jgi:alpha-1,2-mannosyltransferase